MAGEPIGAPGTSHSSDYPSRTSTVAHLPPLTTYHSPGRTKNHLHRPGGDERRHSQGHGQAIKLDQPVLHGPEEKSKHARHLAGYIDQPVDHVQIEDAAELREAQERLNDEIAV